jgi:hypothetical protein
MDMSVDQILWFKNPHKPKKGLKPPVTGILLVMDAPGGSVGQEYVQVASPEDPVKEKRGNKPQNLQVHLKIGILIFPVVILYGTSQSRNDKALLLPYPGTDMDNPVAVLIVIQGA